jgi:SPOR domain
MLSEKRLFHLRKSVATFYIALFVTFFSPHILYPATEHSYAREIELYVAEDKVYLLENIRQNITRPSERTVVDALLCESGPEAIELFRKQLKDYPDPVLNKISTARIAAYSQALNGTAPLPKLSLPLPPAKPNLAEKEENAQQGRLIIAEKPKRDALPPPLPLSEKPKRESVASVIPLQKKSIPKNISLKAHLPDRLKQEATVTKIIGFTLQFGSFAHKENAEVLAEKVSLYKPAKAIQQGEFYKVLLKKNYASKEDVAALVKELPFIAIIVPVKEERH